MLLTYRVKMHAFIILDTPVVIYTDILLRSMGPISEKDMVSRLYENSELCAHNEKLLPICEIVD